MQKSKKMMVSLCGLALSSLFVLNNKSVVHADTANANQNNNAITWDSDQDDSQVVQSAQTKTEQAMLQKADDHQQNVQSVNANHAEIATVSSSLVDRLSATNKSAASVQNSRANLISNVGSAAPGQTPAQQKVASVQNAQAVNHVVIKNPAGNKVHVNWVNSKGEAIPDIDGYDIDLSKVGTRSEYRWIPDGYHLIKNGNYNVTKNTHTEHVPAQTRNTYKTVYDSFSITTNYYLSLGGIDNSNHKYDDLQNGDGVYVDTHEEFRGDETDHGEFGGDETINRVVGCDLRIGDHVFRHQSIYLPAGSGGSEQLIFDGGRVGTIQGYNPEKVIDKTIIDKPAHYETITDGYTFTDNSGAVLKQSGNTIDVGLIKPQHVNPATDARMRATATRTIQFNFPGTIPPSYKNIVNDKGVLTQTVMFTRTGQEDALTGDLIDNTLSPWKSNNQDPNFLGFPERTLPRIPGYTLSIKPV